MACYVGIQEAVASCKYHRVRSIFLSLEDLKGAQAVQEEAAVVVQNVVNDVGGDGDIGHACEVHDGDDDDCELLK